MGAADRTVGTVRAAGTMSGFRVVLDTNCLVSALLFGKGSLATLRAAWQGKRFVPVVCKETASELIRVLSYPKFRLDQDEIHAVLADFLPYAETVALTGPFEDVEGLSDASDAVFIRLAQQTKADWLVSGDSHAPGMRNALPDARIISPGDFLAALDRMPMI